jgi:diacylglycerol kinase (ATP)
MEGPAKAAFFVVNPEAGGGRTRRLWRRLSTALAGRRGEFAVGVTAASGDAVLLARKAADDGWPLVVAVGGDGTLNEVVNGLAVARDPFAAVVGSVMTGRGCDACRNFGLSRDPVVALARALDGEVTRVDVGEARWEAGRARCFVTAAGVGFDAVVARRAAARRWRGTLPYLAAVIETVWTYRAVPGVIDGETPVVWSGLLTAAVVANGAHYGGGMKIAPHADPADGSLDLIVLEDLGRVELLRWLPTVYRGAHLACPKVTALRQRMVTVKARAPVHLDGEAAGEGPVAFSVRPSALRLRR